jgi:hypothetical protein
MRNQPFKPWNVPRVGCVCQTYSLCGGFNYENKRHGKNTLLAALEVATGMVTMRHCPSHRCRELPDFINQLAADYPETELSGIMDNLNAHKPEIECWFSSLWRQSLRSLIVTSFRQLRRVIDAFIKAYSQTANSFVWTKRVVHQSNLKIKYSNFAINGEQTRDFEFNKDIVRANLMAAESTITGIFNIGTGDRISINQLSGLILKIITGEDVKYSIADIPSASSFGHIPDYRLQNVIKEFIVPSALHAAKEV